MDPQVAVFNNAQGINIDRSPFTIQHNSYTFGENGERSGFKALKEATATAAFHNSGECYEPPKCHPCTREAILKKIMSWVKGEIDTDTLIFWLNGTVGVGKSAIAQSIAELCEKENLLLATFFFARSDTTRNNARLFITTLAYQIGRAIPAARHHIDQIFERDPLIYKQSLETQAFQLIIQPLQYAVGQQIEIPPLIIIDGLDECSDASVQCKVLNTISHIISAVKAHGVRLVFLVTSRPEQEISLTFESETIEAISSPYTLNESQDSDGDIRRFLEDSFDKIKKTHPLKSSIPPLWPSNGDLRALVWKASGQFLYAKLVIDYAGNIRRNPPDRLNSILLATQDLDDNPFTTLDALYHHIFASIDDVQSVMKILGLCFTAWTPGYLADIVQDRVGMGFAEVRLLFGDLASVVGVTHSDEGPNAWQMTLWHASLVEFLTTQHRSKQYHVDVKLNHAAWATWLLRENGFNNLRDVYLLEHHLVNSTPHQELRDALQYWDLAGVVVKSPESFFALYRIIVMTRDLELERAHLLYTSQLQVLERQLGDLLGDLLEQFYPAPAYVLLTSRSSVHQHRQLDCFEDTTPEALNCVIHLDGSPGFDPLHLLSPFNQDFYSFIVTFLHDPSKSAQYAVDGAKLAAGALCLMEYLCRPPEELTELSWSTRWVPEKLMTSPWMLRSRYPVRKKFKWFKCYNGDIRYIYCTLHAVTAQHASFACLVPSSPDLLFLHKSAPLLGYMFTLEILLRVLAKASRSDELIAYCRRHVFHPTSVLFPRRTKKARAAVWRYLERMETEDRWYEELWLD